MTTFYRSLLDKTVRNNEPTVPVSPSSIPMSSPIPEPIAPISAPGVVLNDSNEVVDKVLDYLIDSDNYLKEVSI